MSHLQIRRIPFAFDEQTPFQWNPQRPYFGIFCNSVSFTSPPFERYVEATMRAAMPRISDPAVAEEADAFLRQEALHGRAHQLHVEALISKYPGLRSTFDALNKAYDELFASESLEFHLAFCADLEATFTPLVGMILEHREELFDGGDSHVASLFIWHFVEEIEHRRSAFMIYNHVVRSRSYRLRVLPKVMGHILRLKAVALRGFNDHVPASERLVKMTLANSHHAFDGVPTGAQLLMNARLMLSQLPSHDPRAEHIPGFVAEWRDVFDGGGDVMNWYEGTAS